MTLLAFEMKNRLSNSAFYGESSKTNYKYKQTKLLTPYIIENQTSLVEKRFPCLLTSYITSLSLLSKSLAPIQ